MCGITGLLALNPEADRRLSKIKQSTDKLFLRGPDSGNVYTDERCALGHRRLSIMDTSHGADQPMTDHTGRYVIIFNGEIFNFRQLSREYLTGVWPSFAGPKTQSDTEVLLYLLIHHGTELSSLDTRPSFASS